MPESAEQVELTALPLLPLSSGVALPNMVLTIAAETPEARAAVDAGARFIVSPHLRREVIQMARRQGVVVIPGALTATEVMDAWEAGADFVKVFPCQPVGGPAYLRALRGPLPQVAMIPSGGVTGESIPEYLAARAAAVSSGEARRAASAYALTFSRSAKKASQPRSDQDE